MGHCRHMPKEPVAEEDLQELEELEEDRLGMCCCAMPKQMLVFCFGGPMWFWSRRLTWWTCSQTLRSQLDPRNTGNLYKGPSNSQSSTHSARHHPSTF